MKRLLSTLYLDLTLQIRNGLYAATALLTLLWMAVFWQASLDLRGLLPAMLVGNLLVGTFFFIGGLVLLEKDERLPLALLTTPLRFGEYLGSKSLTLTVLALIETLLLAGMATQWQLHWLWLVLGSGLAALIYCLVGYAFVVRYQSINEALLPAAGVAGVLWIPLFADLLGWQHWALALLPLSGPLALVHAALAQQPTQQIVAALLISAIWVAVLAGWCVVAQRRWVRHYSSQ
jgi:fluoroquinolone transport system permease protein